MYKLYYRFYLSWLHVVHMIYMTVAAESSPGVPITNKINSVNIVPPDLQTASNKTYLENRCIYSNRNQARWGMSKKRTNPSNRTPRSVLCDPTTHTRVIKPGQTHFHDIRPLRGAGAN